MSYLLNRIHRWWLGRILRKARIPESVWKRAVHDLPIIGLLPEPDRHRLRELSSLFMHYKTISGAGGLEVDDYMCTVIAAQACLLILNLGLDYYSGWVEVIVYPNAFIAPHEELDEAGVLHQSDSHLSGEAWGRGPVILSWEDIRPQRHHSSQHGINVVLHEFAHKIDLLTGSANGMPPLHQSMTPGKWSEDFSLAYHRMLRHIQGGHGSRIDPYAVESPAEFFAVVTEFFFERPLLLRQELPSVYEQLVRFYRQEPHHYPSA
ncbi:MAG: zinc-dependent peptidase [Pseudomonadota bacterium]